MWKTIKFKTRKAQQKWIEKHGHNYQIEKASGIVFVRVRGSGPYALDVRKLRKIG